MLQKLKNLQDVISKVDESPLLKYLREQGEDQNISFKGCYADYKSIFKGLQQQAYLNNHQGVWTKSTCSEIQFPKKKIKTPSQPNTPKATRWWEYAY